MRQKTLEKLGETSKRNREKEGGDGWKVGIVWGLSLISRG